MSPRVKKKAGVVPAPSVKRYPKTKTKPAMWRAWAYVRLRDDDARVTHVEGTSTLPGDAGKAEALERFQARADAIAGADRKAPPTVGQMAESWLSWRTLCESSRTPGELYDHLSSLSPGAVLTAYTLLRGAFSRAVGLGIITSSPATRDVVPQRPADSQAALRRLTVAEVQQLRDLFRAAEKRPRASTPIYEVTELMLRTGARIGEVLALQVKHIERDVDLFGGDDAQPTVSTLVHITGTQIGTDGDLIRQEHTKTGPSGRRRIRVSESFYRDHLANRVGGRDPDEWLFQARRTTGSARTRMPGELFPEQMLSANNFRTLWRNLIRDTVFEKAQVTPHTYRRTVAQALVDEGQAEVASALLGHVAAATLFRSYAERPVPIVDPSAVLDEMFREQRGPQTEAEWEALYGAVEAVEAVPEAENPE